MIIMIDRETYIAQGLIRHIEEFEKCYPNLEWFALVIQGSQNYGLDIYTEEYKSDIDTKMLVIPSLEDIVYNKKPISTTYILPNNEHTDIKDIRLYFDNFKKQNINFVEILFSNYYIINPKYQDLWNELIKNRENIAHYNYNQTLRCIAGMSMEKKKALCHPYPTIKEKIDKYGYDGKQLHHIIRMNDFIYAYTHNKLYKECLTYLPHKELMMEAKLNKFSLEKALELAEFFDNQTKEMKDFYLKEPEEINQDALNTLNKVQYEVIKRKIKTDIIQEEIGRNEK